MHVMAATHKGRTLTCLQRILPFIIYQHLPISILIPYHIPLIIFMAAQSSALKSSVPPLIMTELYCTSYDPDCNLDIFIGDDPKEHHQACHRRSLPCSVSLKLWAQHDQCGEEVNQGY